VVYLKRFNVFWNFLKFFKKLLFTLPTFYAIHKIEVLIQNKELGKLCRTRHREKEFNFVNDSALYWNHFQNTALTRQIKTYGK